MGTPGYSRCQQPDIDVNAVLSDRYELSRPLFTRAMLWDLEVRKAVAPGDYIPFVVEAGTARSWGPRGAPGGGEYVDRCSRQRLWTRPQDCPLNRWRIVHLTESVDGRILERD